jgi:hypothetical protein
LFKSKGLDGAAKQKEPMFQINEGSRWQERLLTQALGAICAVN